MIAHIKNENKIIVISYIPFEFSHHKNASNILWYPACILYYLRKKKQELIFIPYVLVNGHVKENLFTFNCQFNYVCYQTLVLFAFVYVYYNRNKFFNCMCGQYQYIVSCILAQFCFALKRSVFLFIPKHCKHWIHMGAIWAFAC